MREEEDCQKGQDMSLSGRVARMEKLLAGLGIEEFSGCDRTVTGQRRVDTDEACLATSVKVSALEELTNRVLAAIDRIHRNKYRLDEIGNRVLGVLPQGAAAGNGENIEKVREPDGTLEAAFRALEWLDMAISDLQSKAVRLEGI